MIYGTTLLDSSDNQDGSKIFKHFDQTESAACSKICFTLAISWENNSDRHEYLYSQVPGVELVDGEHVFHDFPVQTFEYYTRVYI